MSRVIGYVAIGKERGRLIDQFSALLIDRKIADGVIATYGDDGPLGPMRVAELREVARCVWTRKGKFWVSACSSHEHEVDGVHPSGIHYCYNCGGHVDMAP